VEQNRCRLALHPDPAGGAYSAPQTPGWDKWDLVLKERKRCREGKGRKRRERRGGREEMEERGKGVEGPLCVYVKIF